MRLRVEHTFRIFEVLFKLCSLHLLPTLHLLSKVVSISNGERIKAHEVGLPILQEVVILIASHLFIEFTVLTWLICPILCFSGFPSFSICLCPMSLFPEGVPIVILLRRSFSKVLLYELFLIFLVCIRVMWLILLRFIMS